MDKNVQAALRALPHTPGVYIFKTNIDEILYIGKAKDLHNRCSSYLSPKADDLKGITIASSASNFEHIPTPTELAALLLEAKLIQHHRPPLNVLLKDGQPFLYFLITQEELPRLLVARNKKQKGAYFGPFVEKGPIRSLHTFLLKTFRLETCTRKMQNGCLRYHMGICAGTCLPSFDLTHYKERLHLVKKLLARGNREVFDEIDRLIAHHNENMEFEISQKLVTAKQNLENFLANKSSVLDINNSLDQFTSRHLWIVHNNHIFLLDEKKLKFTILYTFLAEPDELVDTYLATYYQQHQPPREILLNQDAADVSLIKSFLSTRWNLENTPYISSAPSSHLEHIMRLAELYVINKSLITSESTKELQNFLHLQTPPHIIDCFDISHTQGQNIVGSCVRFIDGAPDKSACRKFIIRSLTNQNDYAALQEIVSRRYKGADELPNLVLIDGGKGQLNAVNAIFYAVQTASIAKREERIFASTLPPEGKLVNKRSKAGKTLMAIRDYAHHFAISFHRKRNVQHTPKIAFK